MQVLTTSEKLLLSSVGLFAISLTAIVMFCLVRKNCWLYKVIWQDEKKNKKQRMDDIICIRYPPDICPTTGVFREHIYGSPQDEMARLFYSPLKRDSTYSSMSDGSGSGGLEGSSPQNTSAGSVSSPATGASTPEHSPDDIQQRRRSSYPVPSVTLTPPIFPLPVVTLPHDRRMSYSHLETGQHPSSAAFARRSSVALAAEAAICANQRFNVIQTNFRQTFFTFILKYEEDLVNIEFIEARNLPAKEYLNRPPDAFFTVEIFPKKESDRKKEALHYRFVTKTVKKAGEICEFSETFLAQLAKASLKDYNVRFTAFDQDRFGNPTELGTTILSFDDFQEFTQSKLVLSCSLKEPQTRRGDIMIGMCYLPTAERMSVTIVKLNNLNHFFSDGTINKESICFVRLLLLRADSGKVVKRKKTTFQKLNGSNANQLVFNETIIFDFPPGELTQTVLLALVCTKGRQMKDESVRRQSSPLPEPLTHPQIYRHRNSDEFLFHYSENLNVKAERKDSNSSGQSHTSQGSSVGKSRSSVSDFETESRRHSDKSLVTLPEDDGNGIISPQRRHLPGDSGIETGENHHRVKDKGQVLGKVGLGYNVKNYQGSFHWRKMIAVPRTVIQEWHPLK